MTKQEPNPYAYGYARMPRIIRKGYKNLTNMQKLLYIYLRDLCGEDGTCYRSLRSLKDETGFSIGYLSVAIPVLHNEGLIHAEMRKTSSTHWEVWHISVIDIWEKNAAFLQAEKAKCSPDEQMNEQSVQEVNRSVHQMNKIAESVQEVNESVHAMILNKNHTNNQLTENNNKEESIVTSAIAGSDAPAATIHDIEVARQRKTDPRIPAVSSHSQADIGNDEDITDAPTEKMRITKPEQTIPAGGSPDAAQRTIVSPQASSVGGTSIARTNGAVQASGKRKGKAVTQADEPVPMPKSDTREIQRRINEHRGYALEEKGQILQERIAIKSWCNLHTIEEFEQVMHYLTTIDKYWKLEENKYRIGGVTLAKETPKALAARHSKQANEKTLGGYYYFSEAM